MTGSETPRIVRAAPSIPYTRPGVHSHNARRQHHATERRSRAFYSVRLFLIVVGLAALGYYGYTLGDEYVYQKYQNWAFDQTIAGRQSVTFADFVRERTSFGFLVGKSAAAAATNAMNAERPMHDTIAPPRPAEGAVLGRVEIPRLNLAAMVREGVDANVLSVAVGHVPSTALPGQAGNFAIAAHRDTLFRALKDIHEGDIVSFESPSGNYNYKVLATKIVKPTDVSVLRPDGGGLIPATEPVSNDGQPNRLLTMITCYPFYYVGSAPKRFIVEAELVGNNDSKGPPDARVSDMSPPFDHAGSHRVRPRRTSLQDREQRPPDPAYGRAFKSSEQVNGAPKNGANGRKMGFWRRLLHV